MQDRGSSSTFWSRYPPSSGMCHPMCWLAEQLVHSNVEPQVSNLLSLTRGRILFQCIIQHQDCDWSHIEILNKSTAKCYVQIYLIILFSLVCRHFLYFIYLFILNRLTNFEFNHAGALVYQISLSLPDAGCPDSSPEERARGPPWKSYPSRLDHPRCTQDISHRLLPHQDDCGWVPFTSDIPRDAADKLDIVASNMGPVNLIFSNRLSVSTD